jgi:hypothetical protein
MTVAKALAFQGTLFKVGNGASPEVFTTIAEFRGFDGPSGSATVLDASTTESTVKEKLKGLFDEGQLSGNLYFDPTDINGQGVLWDARKLSGAAAEKNFQLVFPDSPNTILTIPGFVQSFNVTGQVDGLIEASITIEISGEVTISSWDA